MYILMHKISYKGNMSIGFTDIEIATSSRQSGTPRNDNVIIPSLAKEGKYFHSDLCNSFLRRFAL